MDVVSPPVQTGPASAEPSTQWLRTPPIRDPHGLRAFQDSFTEFLNGICVEPLNGQPLAVEGSVTTFDNMAISIGLTSPTRCTHPYSSTLDDGVILMGWLRGCTSFRACGSEWDLGDGDAMLVQAGQTQTVAAHTASHLCSVTLSRALLGAMRLDVDAALLQVLRGSSAVSMLMAYAHLLRDHSALSTPELRRAAALHMHDLAALALGATGDAAHLAKVRGARAAKLLAVKNDIATHFTDATLSSSSVAQRLGITPRYLHMLLEDEGLSFSTLVLGKRLALARRLLADPRLAGRRISALAFDVGFGDLSYFNRSFRRRFGMTPSEARAQAQKALVAIEKRV